MTVFKAFLKVLNKCKVPIILYTVLLIGFGGFNMQTSDNSTNFVASKPDVYIINEDKEEGITKNLVDYMKNNTNVLEVPSTEEAIDDALFYREVNYIIYIPNHYREEFLKGNNPEIKIKSTGDYQASLADMLLERYSKVANSYQKIITSEEELIGKVNETLEKQTQVEITSKLDTDQLQKASFYYNFTNYSILAGCVYVICLILSSFHEEKIAKRTIISSMSYHSHNRKLLVSNSLFAFFLWGMYVLLSFPLVGNIMFTMHGLVYIINSFLFTICALTIAFLIGNLVSNKNAVNGIVNVVALGSSFLCGAFVPMEWLPDTVLKIAHILPSYYYIKSNELLREIETVNLEALHEIIINMGIIVAFAIGFTIIANIVARKKRKIG
ncbi:MAG: ABC transporter permease [Clostridia bacterium]|nr:ABC transporter permease [Clostridia bacterium]